MAQPVMSPMGGYQPPSNFNMFGQQQMPQAQFMPQKPVMPIAPIENYQSYVKCGNCLICPTAHSFTAIIPTATAVSYAKETTSKS